MVIVELIKGFWNLSKISVEHGFWPGVAVNVSSALKYFLELLKVQAVKYRVEVEGLESYVKVIEHIVQDHIVKYDSINALKKVWECSKIGRIEEWSETLAFECYSALTILLKNVGDCLKVKLAVEWQKHNNIA